MPQIPFQTAAQPQGRNRLRRSLALALFVAAAMWFALAQALAGRAARGLSERLDGEAVQPLLSALFLLFLLAVGFGLLETLSGTGRMSLRRALSLPRRQSSAREWGLGAAVGWGMAVAAVLPMALARSLRVHFWTDRRAFGLLAVELGALLFGALAIEVGLRGYPFQRLIAAIGPTWATLAFCLAVGAAHGAGPDATWISIVATMLGTLLLSLAWLRTHGLWLPWGLHFAWNASVAVLFGLPLRGMAGYASVVQTRAVGSEWWTGGDFGPEAALLTLLCGIAGLVVLVRSTGDYAWEYTRPEIVAAGYEVNPPPPAAHVAMEQEPEARPSLVQIQPVTPRSVSANDA